MRLGGAWTTLRGARLKVHAVEVVDPDATGDELRGDVVGGLRLLARAAGGTGRRCRSTPSPAAHASATVERLGLAI